MYNVMLGRHLYGPYTFGEALAIADGLGSRAEVYEVQSKTFESIKNEQIAPEMFVSKDQELIRLYGPYMNSEADLIKATIPEAFEVIKMRIDLGTLRSITKDLDAYST